MTTKIESKVWFLASGTKKVGPMTKARLRERLADSKAPARLRAWREGMEAWLPVAEIPELDGSSGKVAALASGESLFPATASSEAKTNEAPATETTATEATIADEAKPARLGRPSRLGRSLGSSKASTPAAARPVFSPSSPFAPRYRIDRPELWKAFSMGFELPRLQLAGLLLASGIALQLAVLAGAWLTPILGAILALGAVPVGLVLGAVGLGALAYQTRRRVETGTTPGPFEALAFAKDHALALTLAPFVLSLVSLAPPILLVIKSLVGKIPGIGEPAAGLTFGIDLALSAATLFFGLAAALGWSLSPSIVAFEETGILGTVKALLGVVRSSFPRFVFWSIGPRLATGALAVTLLLGAVLVAAPPLALNFRVLGPVLALGKMIPHGFPSAPAAPSHDPFAAPSHEPTKAGGAKASPAPVEPATPPAAAPAEAALDVSVGLVGVVLWVFVLLGVVASVLASTQSALNGLLYLACRPGNDELVTRDQWLAQQQAAKAEVARAAS